MKFHILLITTVLISIDCFSQQQTRFDGASVVQDFWTFGASSRIECAADINNDGNLDIIQVKYNNRVNIVYGNGSSNFTIDTSYPIGNYDITALDTVDLNNDGYEDIIGVTYGNPNSKIFILMSDSVGVFSLDYMDDTGSYDAVDFTIGDFNADGYKDVAIAAGFDPNMPILFGNSFFTFQPYILFNTGVPVWMYFITSADFNLDGRDDIAVSFENQGQFAIILSLASGGFQSTVQSTGTVAFGIKTADFNQDGYPDIVLSADDTLTTEIILIPGDGTGAFPLSNAIFSPQPGITLRTGELIVEDMNYDGWTDLIMVSRYGDDGHVYLNDGNGQLIYNHRMFFGISHTFGDFDNDGLRDLFFNCHGGSIRSFGFSKGDANGNFKSSLNFDTQYNYRFMESADFNTDGNEDLLILGLGTGYEVLLNNGLGELSSIQNTLVDIGNTFAVDDFNTDSHPDFVTFNSSGNLDVFFCNLNGSFQNPVTYPTNSTDVGTKVTTGQFNSDGKPDIALVYNSTGFLEYDIFLNDGAGGFLPPICTPLAINNVVKAITSGDADADGITDLVALAGSSKLIFLKGAGNGTFAPPILLNTTVNSGLSVQIKGINNDPYPDIVSLFTNRVEIFYGNSSGTFLTSTYFSIFNNICRNFVCEDLNGDWNLDIATVSDDRGLFAIYLGDGTGNFILADTLYPAGSGASNIVGIDFDGDGKIDLADNSITILKNISPYSIITSNYSSPITNWLYSFPNPSTGLFTVGGTPFGSFSEYAIYNTYGEALEKKTLTIYSDKLMIDLTSYPAGIYFLHYSSSNQNFVVTLSKI
ncbi:MAG TPA: FG-GAP-like repeat-containing protein [Bacteroidia bacterium]|nr:FG-GAP-like repeat-containing protein [Bacteroidia bacterium]